MVWTTVEKSSSLVYCLTARRSNSSSRGSGRRAFSSKARVMTVSGVPWAKRSKRGSKSMAGLLGGHGGRTQTTYPLAPVPGIVSPSRPGSCTHESRLSLAASHLLSDLCGQRETDEGGPQAVHVRRRAQFLHLSRRLLRAHEGRRPHHPHRRLRSPAPQRAQQPLLVRGRLAGIR